jgi:hypothetical protein
MKEGLRFKGYFMRDLNNPSDDKLSNLWGDDFKL